MGNLNVRDVPEQMHNELRHLARAERRSLRAEVIELLDGALALKRERARVSQLLDDIRRNRITLPPGSPTTDEMLREDRAR
ncbi:MAG TPA: hypothetical protein VNE39_25065 [Planctomycetota bacterium]|nr:hypothetical protein [Planctomycetota bacterium]